MHKSAAHSWGTPLNLRLYIRRHSKRTQNNGKNSNTIFKPASCPNLTWSLFLLQLLLLLRTDFGRSQGLTGTAPVSGSRFSRWVSIQPNLVHPVCNNSWGIPRPIFKSRWRKRMNIQKHEKLILVDWNVLMIIFWQFWNKYNHHMEQMEANSEKSWDQTMLAFLKFLVLVLFSFTESAAMRISQN